MSSSSGPLSLPLACHDTESQAAYAAVPGAGSPCSGTGSPTAREVRLECKDPAASADGENKVIEHPMRRRFMYAAFAVVGLLGAAVAAFVLCQVWEKNTPAGPRFQKISHGSCESNGLLRIRSAHLCAEAAKELNLKDHTVREVPSDATAGLNRNLMDEMPEDCYYLTMTALETHYSLWFNSHTPGSEATRASSGPIKREPICMFPNHHDEHASMAEGEEPPSFPMLELPKSLPVPDAIKTLIFGSTTTTTTQTTTSTGTGTSTTETSTTKTKTASTTSLTTTSITTTSFTITSTTSETTTSTFSTTYHNTPTVFCYSVMRIDSYELNNVRTALAKKTSIFACDDFILFSDQPYTVQPGVPVPGFGDLQFVDGIAPVQTVILRRDLTTTPKAGSLEGILNTQIFMQAWHQVSEDGRFRLHDWTIKVDPDAVFFPQRLIPDLASFAPASSSPNMYLVNCKISFGLFGAVEVFSRVALETYIAGEERCKNELDWTMMGEDLWMKRCLDLLAVQHADDFHILSDGYCSEQASPCQSGKVSFHPFKDALSYLQCYNEAITPTTTTTSTLTHTGTKEHHHHGSKHFLTHHDKDESEKED
mmetsp:Transcript_93735/g.301704  ORF Transcript_93735/g.301704 Transcript_93735/m.301704 type:complete len:594 (-) Transcript_93735:187-1968(-)